MRRGGGGQQARHEGPPKGAPHGEELDSINIDFDVQINLVKGCVSAVLVHATFDHDYLCNRVHSERHRVQCAILLNSSRIASASSVFTGLLSFIVLVYVVVAK